MLAMAPHTLTALLSPYLILLLPFLLFALYRRRQGPNLPPGPPPFPIIGNLHHLGNLPHLSFHRLSEKYGPIIYLKLGQVPAIVVCSADLASEILKSQDHVFCSRSQLMALRVLSYGGKDIAFSPFDDDWKHVRRISNTELFSLSKVQTFSGIRRAEVDVLVDTILKACSRKEQINLSEMFICFFNNVIFREVFGERISADGECRRSPLQELLREVVALMAGFGVGDLFPSMGRIDSFTGWRKRLDRTFKKMDMYFQGKIQERMSIKSNGDGCYRREGFIDALLNLHSVKEDDQLLTMNQIKGILFDMFTGGTDTSAAAVEWGMTQLMKNPAVMKKAQAEVRRVVGDKGKVEESDLQYLPYLKMVIKESMRLHPPGPLLLPRECMKDTKINGYDIPAKTRVYVNVWSIGRDPNYWANDPEVFRPERFENSAVTFKGSHFGLLPFGAGRRICPGVSLAMPSIELVYASILYGFDWDLPDGMNQEDIDMRQEYGIVTSKKVPLVLLATPTFIKS